MTMSIPAVTSTTPALNVANIHCRYRHENAVNGVDFTVGAGELACLLGPSGCGKTTVLRAIAGFQPVQQGQIEINGRCVATPAHHLPPEQRKLGMVFQEHALFPHLTVADNIAAGLHTQTPAARATTVANMLDYVQLQAYSHRYPHELSGGQQQRVALARALAPSPVLLLLDEPFSNIDWVLREQLGVEMRALLKQIGTTAILVTHDQQDAFTFSDQVGVMRAGTILQWDTPYNLYHQPATRFVADFVGDGVFLAATILSNDQIQCELATLQGDLPSEAKPGQAIQLLVRPDDIIHDDHSPMTARITSKLFRGDSYLYTLQLPSGNKLLALAPSHHNHAIGEQLGIKLEIDHLVYFGV